MFSKAIHPTTSQNQLKIGLFGIGLDTYWNQFEGLKPRLEGYLHTVASKIESINSTVLNLGLIDNTDKAFEAGHQFRSADVDLIFLYVSTYALSATVLPIVQRAGVPVVILNLSPQDAIDYNSFNAMESRTQMTGEWLAHCSSCAVPEISNVFKRAGIPFYEVTGMLDNDQECWTVIEEWIAAAQVANIMFHNRLGCIGHYYSGMLDIYTDLTQQLATFGGHMEMIEVEELASLRNKVSPASVAERIQYIYEQFDVAPESSITDLESAARSSVALDMLAEKYKLGSIAYYYKGTGNAENEEAISSIIIGSSILTARGIPVAGEYEIKNAQAMKIMDSFGAGGSFTEYYAMDFKDDVVLMGHDGPGHIQIAEGKTKIKPLKEYHGKVGSGLSVEMSVKNGPVTLLSVVQKADGQLMLLIAEGASVPGPILEIGNTNSRYKFSIGARKFVNTWNSYGPAHHCAIGTGHIASKIEKLGRLLNIQTIQVC